MIQIVDNKNTPLYSLNEIAKLLDISKSTVRRTIIKLNLFQELEYNRQFLYSEQSVLKLVQELIEIKLKRTND
jgi:predicted DNA-binding protein YlxM (UPF0122 family)